MLILLIYYRRYLLICRLTETVGDRHSIVPISKSTVYITALYFSGIPWISIDINDNEMILKLIEEPSRGILSIIDETTTKGDKSDEDILTQMDKGFVVNPHYSSNSTGDQSLRRDEFMIKHYEIEVMYSTKRFIAKNRDALSTVSNACTIVK